MKNFYTKYFAEYKKLAFDEKNYRCNSWKVCLRGFVIRL